MAQIIECPACSTRYKLNKVIPEEGRNVKCARCDHQWMAVPEATLSEPAIAGQDDSDSQASIPQGPVQGPFQDENEDDAQHVPAHAEVDGPEFDDHAAAYGQDEDWQPPVDEGEAGIPEQAGPETVGYGGVEDEEDYAAEDETEAAAESGKGETGGNWWERKPNPLSGERFDEQEFDDEGRESYEDEPVSDIGETAAPVASPSPTDWSSRFMGPSWRGEAEVETEEADDQEAENAEIAIRETFKAALEQPHDEAPEQTSVRADEQEAFREEYKAAWERSDQANPRKAPPVQQPASFPAGGLGGPGLHQSMPVPESLQEKPELDGYYSGEEQTEQTGQTAFEPQRASHAGRNGPFEDGEGDYDDPDEAGFEPVGADLFARRNGLTPQFGEQEEQLSGAYDEDAGVKSPLRSESGLESFDDEPYDDDPFGNPSGQDLTKETTAEDFPPLHHDLGAEETDDYFPAEERGGGGLAVAASWAVFLAAFGGIVVALVNFRQDIVTALPGTIELYRTLGYDASVKQVDFSGVDYRWSQVDGQPTIELKGEVVNITDKTVKVPRVLVNVQNSAGVPVTATANVPTDRLGPGESVTFTLELVAPPEDVTQIELEFAQTD